MKRVLAAPRMIRDWRAFRAGTPSANQLFQDRRIVLCHATEKSGFTLTCATDNALESYLPALLQGRAHH